MPEPVRNRRSLETADATRGGGDCPICGVRGSGSGPAIERFGEGFCSEAHAEEFAQEVRAARVQAVLARQVGDEAGRVAGRSGWKAGVGKAICWGVPVLAIVFVLARGVPALGTATAALPLLGALACPLAMYLMMRSMSHTGHPDSREGKGPDRHDRSA
jgi:hypothetical protein